MKKIFSLFMAFAMMFMFASCENETPEPGGGNTPQPDDPAGGTLATPVLSIVDVTESSFAVEWEAVEHAASYTVVLKSDVREVADTRVVFENLEVGEYTVRVKAVAEKGSGWTDSSYAAATATIQGLTSVDWFEQTLYVTNDEQNNIYSYNTLLVDWSGNGVASLEYGLFKSEAIANLSIADIRKKLVKFDDEKKVLDVINNGGTTFTFAGMDGGVEYTLYTYVKNNEGQEFLAISKCTTDPAKPSAEAQRWLGTWSVTSTDTIIFDADGNHSFGSEEQTFDVEISTSSTSPNEVYIMGLSSVSASSSAKCLVDGNTLYIMNGHIVESVEEHNYRWLAYCRVGGTEYQFFNNEIPSYVLTMDDSGNVRCELFASEATFEGGARKLVEVVHTEIYAEHKSTGDISFIGSLPATYRSGIMSWTKK